MIQKMCKKLYQMRSERKALELQYKRMVAVVADQPMFDGRGTGVDVYFCDKCGASFYTQYVDKGVTPFTIACRDCGDIAKHVKTVRYAEWKILERVGNELHSWMRPTLGQFLKLKPAAREHVLRGGLMLREELEAL